LLSAESPRDGGRRDHHSGTRSTLGATVKTGSFARNATPKRLSTSMTCDNAYNPQRQCRAGRSHVYPMPIFLLIWKQPAGIADEQ